MSTIALENDCLVDQPTPIHQQFTYVDWGIGPFSILYPSIKLGHRTQNNHHGIDIALQGYCHKSQFALCIKASMAYQHYFYPNPSSQVYVGLGAAVGNLYSPLCYFYDSILLFSVSPEITLGKQYTNEAGKVRFVQIQVNAPIYLTTDFKSDYYPLDTPGITLSYGISF